MIVFVVLWILGAILSWCAVALYGKCTSGTTWKQFFELVKKTKGTTSQELGKCILYIVAWPFEIIAVIYSIWYKKYMMRKMIKSFTILDKKES